MNTIVLSANYGYLDKAETTIKSILYHNPHVKIYLFNYDIPQEWFININQYTKQFGSQIIDAKFNPDLVRNGNLNDPHINEMTYARLLIPKLIPEDKVLYLDTDIVVDDNLDDLFKMDFDGNKILAILDIYSGHPQKGIDEFNAGVMLIDNARLRENSNTSDELLSHISDANNINGDQTIINNYFKDEIGLLPLTYNYEIGFDYVAFWNHNQDLMNLLDSIKHPKIIHYCMDDKPFNMISFGRMREKWWFYHDLEMSEITQKHTILDISKIGENNFDGELFVFTYSAGMQHLEELIEKLPNFHFNIMAWTEMWWGLEALIKYPNVSVYPHVIGKNLDAVVAKTDIYLDINYGMKDKDIMKRLENRNVPILSFEDTGNNESKYEKYTIFKNDQTDSMVEFIQNIKSK